MILVSNFSSATCNNTTDNKRKSQLIYSYCISGVFLIIAVWTIITNSMILYAPRIYQPLRIKSTAFISSLAAADLITGFLLPATWFMGSDFTFKWTRPDLFCASLTVLYEFPLVCSLFNLLLISLDRFTAIVYPHDYNELLSPKRVRILLFGAWILSAILSLINLVWHQKDKNGEVPCNVKAIKPLHFYTVVSPIYWITHIVIFGLYFKIFLVIQSRLRNKKERTGKDSTIDQAAVKMVIITVGIFIINWTPFIITLHLVVASVIPTRVVYFTILFAFLNSGVNFFIYGLKNKEYRKAFKKMVNCCRTSDL